MELQIKKAIIRKHKRVQKMASELHDNHIYKNVKCEFYRRKTGRVIAFYSPYYNTIKYNLSYLPKYKKYWDEIIKHEFAHVVDYARKKGSFLNSKGTRNDYHGKTWVQACKDLKCKKITVYYAL